MTVKQEYREFLSDYFNGLNVCRPLFYNWDKGLRFDLQVGSTDTEEYFNEVTRRATTLFQAVFNPGDNVFIVLHDYRWKRRKIRISNYCFKQIRDLKKSEISYSVIKHLYDPKDNWNVALIKLKADRINFHNILTAIGNTDFPSRQPRLATRGILSSKEIFFINIDKKLIFNMYDDRGLDIIANDIGMLRPVYEKYNEWILDYNRERIETTMK